jgi:asparagine synthase (glutamine-hydrolysing)
LAGCLSLEDTALDPEILRRMVASTPYVHLESVTSWWKGPAALIRFEHATTPQAAHDRQPLTDDAAELTICVDGRLDNRDQILAELPDAALDRDSSDCAIVLELFKRVGTACPRHLVGDYVIAVWQARMRQLFCARSPVGWRRLVWCRHRMVMAFATEPATLVDGLALPRRLNEGAIAEYLSMCFTTQADTFWQDVFRLPPGSAMVADARGVRTWHWHTGPFPDSSHLTDEEHVEKFRQLFDQAISASVGRSTPVAAHLSGGLDSSSIVCRATQLYRSGLIGQQVRPISARYPGQPHDEAEWSASVEAHLGITATAVSPSNYDWDEHEAWTGRTLHLPLRPNAIGLALTIPAHMREAGIRVVLTGEGGDDWLRGSLAHWPDLLRQGRVRQLLAEGMIPSSRSPLRRLARVVRDSAAPLLSTNRRERLFRPHLNFTRQTPPWVQPAWADRVGLRDRWTSDRLPLELDGIWQHQRYGMYVVARRHIDFDNVLAWTSQQGVELRHPFHDRRLTEYLLGAPGRLFTRGNERKGLLREAMRGVLPERIRTRLTKADFTATVVSTIVRRLSESDVSRLEPVRRGWLDGVRLKEFLQAYRRWDRDGYASAPPLGPLGSLWPALAIDCWLKHAYRGQ